jgi:hypothetical protein
MLGVHDKLANIKFAVSSGLEQLTLPIAIGTVGAWFDNQKNVESIWAYIPDAP